MNKVPSIFPCRFSKLDELIGKTIISYEKRLETGGLCEFGFRHGQDRTADIYHVKTAAPLRANKNNSLNIIKFPRETHQQAITDLSQGNQGGRNG